jgi:hypothetical protein
MNAILTDELARAVEAQGEIPLRAVNPTTGKHYVVVTEELYERLKPLFEPEPLSAAERQFQLKQAGARAGWDEPAMDAYDDYDIHQPRTNELKSREAMLF